MPVSQFTIVLLTRGYTRNSYLDLIFDMYIKFIKPESVRELIIVSPDYIKDFKFKKLFESGFKVKNIRDSSFQKKIPNSPIDFPQNISDPWIRQQILKLQVSKFVETELYLILDDDMFPVCDLDYSSLYEGDKLKFNNEFVRDLGKPTYSSKLWYEGSHEMLGLDFNSLRGDEEIMGVTPQIMVTKCVVNMIEEFETENKNPYSWIGKFVETKASEFALYWTWLKKKEMTGIYTSDCKQLWYTNVECNILEPVYTLQELAIKLKTGVVNNPGYFTTIQSYFNIPREIITKLVESFVSQFHSE
jgi:hypothetical protein